MVPINNITSDQAIVSEPVKILPAWLVYGVFGVMLLALFIILDISWPFSTALYRFESEHFTFLFLSLVPLIVAILVIISYVVYFFLRAFVRTSIKPVKPNSVPLFERLLLGPLTLSALMFVLAAKVYPLFFFHRGEEPNISAALTLSAYLSSFTIAFFALGLITFLLAQTRKRYSIMFFISIGFVVTTPIIGGFIAPIGDFVYNVQLQKGYQEASMAENMTDCAKAQAGTVWVDCMSRFMKSREDYNICLIQAPSKDFSDKGRSSMLCDREFESFAKKHSFAMNDCAGLTRYRAWYACINSAFQAQDDYAVCVEQATDMIRDYGLGSASIGCDIRLAGVVHRYDLCDTMTDNAQQYRIDYRLCSQGVLDALPASYDPASCYLAREVSSQRACFEKLLKLNSEDSVSIEKICQTLRNKFLSSNKGEYNWNPTACL